MPAVRILMRAKNRRAIEDCFRHDSERGARKSALPRCRFVANQHGPRPYDFPSDGSQIAALSIYTTDRKRQTPSQTGSAVSLAHVPWLAVGRLGCDTKPFLG
jgi:hypothetical protein